MRAGQAAMEAYHQNRLAQGNEDGPSDDEEEEEEEETKDD